MADFPTSPHTFTDFANGATTDAAQVTDIYEEVEAIEAGYLNGTARLNSSNSTVANLSVLGTVYAPAQPRCFVYSSAAQAFPIATFTPVTFESEDYDVGGLHSTATNPDRITIPTGSSGLYLVGALIRMSTGGPGDAALLRFVKNSTTEVGGGPGVIRSSVASMSLQFQQALVLDAGDFLTVDVSAVTSTGSTPSAAARRATSEFWCVKLW